MGTTLSIYDIEIGNVRVTNENCQERVTSLRQKSGLQIDGYFLADPFSKPSEDSIIKLVAIASELKMIFNMRFFILITLLRMTLSNLQFTMERNSGHIFRL